MAERMLTRDEVVAILERLAEELSAALHERPHMHVITVLEGGARTAEALCALAGEPGAWLRDTVRVTSYHGTERRDAVTFLEAWAHPVAGHDVLLIDDIIDSGNTVRTLAARLLAEGAASVSVCALLVREGQLEAVRADSRFRQVCVGWEVPAGKFVYGFGMGIDGEYRDLDEIWAV